MTRLHTRYLPLLMSALLATTLPAGAASVIASPDVAESGTLTIANTLEYAPFEFIDEDGKQVGINIELAEETARRVGAELDILRLPFPSMIPGLAAGKFTVAWETFAATEERLAQVDFVMFIKSGIVASTTPDKTAMFEGDDNLCGKRVGTIAGAAADLLADELNEACVAKGLDPIERQNFPEGKDIIQAVFSDRLDARLDDATASGYFEVTSGGRLVVVPGLYDVAPLGVAVPKGDAATAEMIRGAIQAMIEDGTYRDIMDKYGMTSAMIETSYIVDSVDDIRD